MHKCRTYFNITSQNFIDVNEICKQLEIDIKNVKLNKYLNSIEIGNCEEYDVNINNMLRITLSNIIGKVDVLIYLKNKYNFTYYLERVVNIDPLSEEVTPILGLDNDIIEFLYKTQTIDDVDYYI